MTQLLRLLRENVKLVKGVFFILAITLYPATTFAHARLLRSQPAANANLKQAPKSVELWFSEELEKNLSAVAVTDSSGKQVDKNGSGANAGFG